MDEPIRRFGELIAAKILARDWPGVHTLLAPWLRSRTSVDDVRDFFEEDYRATLAASGQAEFHLPAQFRLSGNATKLSRLREVDPLAPAPRPIAEEVTEANFRQWMMVALECSDEQLGQLDFDEFGEVWMIVVELDEGLRVGYWSHHPY